MPKSYTLEQYQTLQAKAIAKHEFQQLKVDDEGNLKVSKLAISGATKHIKKMVDGTEVKGAYTDEKGVAHAARQAVAPVPDFGYDLTNSFAGSRALLQQQLGAVGMFDARAFYDARELAAGDSSLLKRNLDALVEGHKRYVEVTKPKTGAFGKALEDVNGYYAAYKQGVTVANKEKKAAAVGSPRGKGGKRSAADVLTEAKTAQCGGNAYDITAWDSEKNTGAKKTKIPLAGGRSKKFHDVANNLLIDFEKAGAFENAVSFYESAGWSRRDATALVTGFRNQRASAGSPAGMMMPMTGLGSPAAAPCVPQPVARGLPTLLKPTLARK